MPQSKRLKPGISSSPPDEAVWNAIPDPVLVVDRDFRITAVNPATVARFGAVAAVGGDFWSVFPDAIELARDRLYRLAMDEQSSARFEQPHTLSGLWYTVRCRPLDGGMLVVLTDVSDLKRTDQAADDRARRYRLIFERSPQAAIMYDTRTRAILMANDAAWSLYGYPRDSLLEQDLLQLIVEADRPRIADLINRLRSDLTVYNVQSRHCRRDGTEFDVEVSSHGFVADGRPVRLIQVVDVTEKLKAEKARQDGEQMLRLVIDATADGIWQYHIPDRRLEFSDRLFQMLMRDPAVETARQALERSVINPADYQRIVDRYHAHLRDGGTFDLLLQLRRGDGTVGHFRTRAKLLNDGNGHPIKFAGSMTDVTDGVVAEETLRDAKETAELANSRKDQFLAVLSHELRTPLTPALLMASSLRSDPGIPEDVREALVLISDQIELEAHLIDDLLDLTRITRGKFFLDPKPLDGKVLVEKAVEAARPVLEAAGLTFVVDLAADSNRLNADSKRLQQVLNNLLGNAAKFTSSGGTVTVRTLNAKHGNGPRIDLVVEVTDTGIGIDPALLPQVFNAFEQGEQSITRKYGGLGLGLTIGHAIAESHGGTLSAASEGLGRGTTMTLRLPLQVSATVVPLAPQPKPRVEPGVSILLVEDNLPTLRMLSTLLSKLGHRVRAVSNPADAIESARHDKPDLLVSDIGMPGKSGWSLLEELRSAVDGHLPAIAVSGYGTDEDLKRSQAAGFADHLVKPIDAERLRAAVNDVIRKKQ